MPEESNRRVTYLLAALLYVSAPLGLANLRREGIVGDCVVRVGNGHDATTQARRLPRPRHGAVSETGS